MKAEDNVIKVSLDKINLSDDASRRILNNILHTKHKKHNFCKCSFACVATIILFFVIFECTLFSNKTNSSLSTMHGLSNEYDNCIIGSIYQYENEDVLFKVEECFNDLNEITLFISTRFKKIDAHIGMDFLRLKTDTDNVPIYMSHNCNIKDNTLYTVFSIQKSHLYNEMFLCFDDIFNSAECISFPLEISDIETKSITCDPYSIGDSLILNKIVISQYGLYLTLNISGETTIEKNKDLFSIIEDHNIAVKLKSKRVIDVKTDINDSSIFTNYMSKQEDEDSYIIKYPFKDAIDLNKIEGVIIDNEIFKTN